MRNLLATLIFMGVLGLLFAAEDTESSINAASNSFPLPGSWQAMSAGWGKRIFGYNGIRGSPLKYKWSPNAWKSPQIGRSFQS